MKYRLRTLMMAMAIGPIVIWAAWTWWPRNAQRLPDGYWTYDTVMYFPPLPPDFDLSDAVAEAAKARESR